MIYSKNITLVIYTLVGFLIGIIIQILIFYLDLKSTSIGFSFTNLYLQQKSSNLHFSLNFITLILSLMFYYLGLLKIENNSLKYDIKSLKDSYRVDSKNDKLIQNQNSLIFDNNILLNSLIKIFKLEYNNKNIDKIIENNNYLYNTLIELEYLKNNRVNNHLALSYNKFFLEDIVNYIDSKYSNSIRSSGLNFSIIKPTKNNYYSGYLDFITKVLECFISNSMYETKEGNITFKIDEINDYIIFSVKNTGLGTLTTDYLEKCYEFYDSIGVLSISRWSLPIYYKAASLYNYEIEINSILSKSSEYKLKVKVIKNILSNKVFDEINSEKIDSNFQNNDKFIDISIINNIIEINQDKILLKELIYDFNRDKELIDEAKRLFNLEKFNDLKQIIEKIKGPSINLGANKMSSLCDKINTTILSTNKQNLKQLLDKLDECFTKTCIELNKIIE